MKKKDIRHRFTPLSLLSLLFMPALSRAQITDGDAGPLQDILVSFLIFTNDFLIPAILGLGFFMFVWWVFRYFIFGGGDEESVQKGKSYVVYAIVGFVIIILFFGIVNLIAQSIGLEGEVLDNIPVIPMPFR